MSKIPAWLEKARECSGHQDEVWAKIVIWNVTDISTSDQTHSCYFRFDYGWYDPEVPQEILKNYPDVDAGQKPDDEILKVVYAKRPSFEMIDSTEVEWVDQQGPYVTARKEGGCDVAMYHNIKGTFRDPVDIRDFPYDIQDFKITIGLCASTCEFNEGYFNVNWKLVMQKDSKDIGASELSVMNTANKWTPEFDIDGLLPDGWTDKDSWMKDYGYEVLHTTTNDIIGYEAQISFAYATQRNHFFYTVNILAVTTCMSIFTWLGFAIAPGDVSDRLGYDITILLTVVALKFAFTDAVPIVPYNTMLDWKIGITTAIVFIVTLVQTSIGYMARVGSEEQAEDLDKLMAIIMAVISGVFEILYWLVARHKMNRTAKDHFEDQDAVERSSAGRGSFAFLPTNSPLVPRGPPTHNMTPPGLSPSPLTNESISGGLASEKYSNRNIGTPC